MSELSRQETERQLEQSQRLVRQANDTLTTERIVAFIKELKLKLERDE
jgi:hypothetical protein